MKEALIEAKKAFNKNEVPIGCVVVMNDKIIGRGHNLRETEKNPIMHAEIIALQKAAETLGGWRLTGAELYATIEPCVMCAGAAKQARISKIIFGSLDPKGGAVISLFNIPEDDRLNHIVEVEYGVLESECSDIVKKFFKKLR